MRHLKDVMGSNWMAYCVIRSANRVIMESRFVCWERCKSGYEDHGLTCYKSIIPWDVYGKKSYTRTAGTIPNYNVDFDHQQGFGPGDSGSPVIVEMNGKPYQIGVATKVIVDDQKTPLSTYPAVLSSVPYFY